MNNNLSKQSPRKSYKKIGKKLESSNKKRNSKDFSDISEYKMIKHENFSSDEDNDLIELKNKRHRRIFSKDPSEWSKSTMIKHQKVPFKEDNDLTELEKKYCSCILKVSEKSSEDCLKNKKWGKTDKEGNQCYNPYAICALHGGSNKKCGIHYDYDNFTLEQLQAYAYARKIRIRNKNSRKMLLDDLLNYKFHEYEDDDE